MDAGYIYMQSGGPNRVQSVSICLNTFQSCLMMSLTVSMVKLKLRVYEILMTKHGEITSLINHIDSCNYSC